jgi:heavy metal translocating P-type ATPase
MLLDVGLVLAAYAGVRFYESCQSRRLKRWMVKSDLPSQPEPPKEKIVDDADTRKNWHYVKMSVATMGIAAVRNVHPFFALINLGMFTYIVIPYLKQFEQSLIRERKIDGYVLYGVADMMTLGLSRYVTVSFAVGLLHTAKFIMSRAKDQTKKVLLEVIAQQPYNVWILKDNAEIEVPIESLQRHDIVIVNTGEVIPVDGFIVDGIATIDQHALTGESQPAEKGVGDRVYASTILITGRIYIRVEKSGAETTVAKIGQILNQSIDFKTQLQLKGEQWADSWNVPVLGLAFLGWPFLGPVGTVAILNGHIAQSIRVVAPLGTLNHINLASHQGILIKDGRALEELNKVDTILFDKTGTLTQEQPTVRRIIVSHDETTEDEILTYAAAAERKLAHPIARAIVAKAVENQLILPEIADSKYQIGYGITVNINDRIIRVGSIRFMETEGIALPTTIEQAIVHAHDKGYSLILVAVNDAVIGALEMQASVRPEIKQVIQGLRQRGIQHFAIVSGDHQQPTQKLAEFLGIENYFYEVLPEDKARIVEELQAEGRVVAFVGDGVNDAIAMKKANVAISLRGATTIATDVAPIVFMDGTLSHLTDIFDLSANLAVNLRTGLLINIVLGGATVASAFLFHIGILTAILLNQSGLALGIGNAMLPLLQIKEETKLADDESVAKVNKISLNETQASYQAATT